LKAQTKLLKSSNETFFKMILFSGFNCSSYYAFSAQSAIEGAIFKNYGKLEKLSEQNLIDYNVNKITGNWGCDVSVC
jgi:Papain family cysteine protease